MPDYSTARYHMVECQIRTNNVNDPRLIKALQEVPRELFVPDPFRSIAYLDHDLKIADGRFLMEPMVLARLLQLAEIQPTDIVLDIGCTTGYAAAILARLAATVVALESDSLLAKRATATLARLEADNVVVVEGALNEGYAEQAPYDVIVVGGLVPGNFTGHCLPAWRGRPVGRCRCAR